MYLFIYLSIYIYVAIHIHNYVRIIYIRICIRLNEAITNLPSADGGFEFCVWNSTRNGTLEASDACTVNVMLSSDSSAE